MNPQKKTNQDGMKAALTAQKFIPSIKETVKGGVKETRQLTLTGKFAVFVDGQQNPVRLPVKLEFKDTPANVQLVQTALNIEDTGEQCLLVIFSNRKQRLDNFLEALKVREKEQELKFAPPKDDDITLDDEE